MFQCFKVSMFQGFKVSTYKTDARLHSVFETLKLCNLETLHFETLNFEPLLDAASPRMFS